jgi:putative Ca2+/H+ antiporter (TMEM165/GDT1 family)
MGDGHRDRPEVRMGTLWITASWIGAVLAVGLGEMVYESLPETRLFLLGSLGLVVVGAVLWWKHR